MLGSVVGSLEHVIIFVVFLSVLIIVHEWGHFITAKRLGVEVERFALGFGPTVFSKMYNGTRYMVNAIPLGGYVKMAGDERSEYHGQPNEFLAKSPGHRALVIVNGPVVNFILAYVSFVVVFMIGYPGHSTKITAVTPDGPAQVAGLQVGDKIVVVGAKKIYGLLNLDSRLEGAGPEPLEVTVVRDGKEMTKTVTPEVIRKPNLVGRVRTTRDLGIDTLPSSENLPNVVGRVEPGYPAQKAGLKIGDRIVAIDGRPVTDWTSLQSAVEQSSQEQIEVKLVRDGAELVKSIAPMIVTDTDDAGGEVQVRRIGISPQQEVELDLFRFGFVDAIIFSGEELGYITVLTGEALYRLVTGAVKAEESVTGPIGIFYIVKGAAESGFSHVLYVLGVISASLAIFNLLPVIPLDGGHIFLLGIEKIRGRPLSPKVDAYVAKVGIGLIIALALFIFYVDFSRWGWFEFFGDLFGKAKNLFLSGPAR